MSHTYQELLDLGAPPLPPGQAYRLTPVFLFNEGYPGKVVVEVIALGGRPPYELSPPYLADSIADVATLLKACKFVADIAEERSRARRAAAEWAGTYGPE